MLVTISELLGSRNGNAGLTDTSRSDKLAGRGIDMLDAPALGTAEDAKTGKLAFVVGGPEAAVERCRPIFEALGERILRAGVAGSGQAAAALADFLRGVEVLAATEALRIAQRFGLDAATLLDIGEGLSAVGPLVCSILRRQVLTRQFDSGLALGHLLKNLETASSVAQAYVCRRRCSPLVAIPGRRLRSVSARAPTSRH